MLSSPYKIQQGVALSRYFEWSHLMPNTPKRPQDTAHEDALPALKSDWDTWFANDGVTSDFITWREQPADQHRYTLISGVHQGR
jgi:hypothetical protein